MDRWTCDVCTTRNYYADATCAGCMQSCTLRPEDAQALTHVSNAVQSHSLNRENFDDYDVVHVDDDDAVISYDTVGLQSTVPPATFATKQPSQLLGPQIIKRRRVIASTMSSPIGDIESPTPQQHAGRSNEVDNECYHRDASSIMQGATVLQGDLDVNSAVALGQVTKAEIAAVARAAAQEAKTAATKAEKAAQIAARNVEKADRGGFSKQEIMAVLSPDLASNVYGAAITNALEAAKYTVGGSSQRAIDVQASDVPVVSVPSMERAIQWRRRRIDSRARGSLLSTTTSTLEPFFAQLYCDDEGIAGVAMRVESLRAELNEGTRIIFILQGERQAAGRTVAAAAAGRSSEHSAFVTSDDIDNANMSLYISHDLEIKETLNIEQTVEYVVGLTRAIAEYPYRMNPTALACVTKVRVTGAGGATNGIAGAGDGDTGDSSDKAEAASAAESARGKRSSTETWIAQLQMIPQVSAKVAKAITARYPTFRTLMDAYADSSLSPSDKARLLEDIRIGVSGAGQKATQLSANIYRLFCTTNKDEIIGVQK